MVSSVFKGPSLVLVKNLLSSRLVDLVSTKHGGQHIGHVNMKVAKSRCTFLILSNLAHKLIHPSLCIYGRGGTFFLGDMVPK